MVRLELIGFLFIAVAGSILHFTYAMSGNLWWVGVFSAMNESVWEHLKLAFWPSLAWTVLLRFRARPRVSNFWIGRLVAMLIPPILISVGYYAYTAVLGHHALVFDILLFLIAIMCGQAAAIFLYAFRNFGARANTSAIALIAVTAFLFATLSFAPPNAPLFVDPTIEQHML